MTSRAPEAIEDKATTERRCSDCASLSPPGVSEYTLISSRFGWRVTKATTSLGTPVLRWHCASCFAKRRSMKPVPRG
jgi:hypothetical protein